MPENITLWKFLRTGMKSEYGNCSWRVGEWKKNDTPLDMCESGFHASSLIIDAFSYVKGEILAKVEVSGKHLEQRDKQCWSEMRVIKAYRWTREDSIKLAIFSAEQVLSLYEDEYPTDKWPREVIAAVKNYLEYPADAAARAAHAAAYAAYAARAADAAARAAYAADAAARAANAADATARAARAAYAAAYAARAAYAAAYAARAANAAAYAADAADAAARAARAAHAAYAAARAAYAAYAADAADAAYAADAAARAARAARAAALDTITTWMQEHVHEMEEIHDDEN